MEPYTLASSDPLGLGNMPAAAFADVDGSESSCKLVVYLSGDGGREVVVEAI